MKTAGATEKTETTTASATAGPSPANLTETPKAGGWGRSLRRALLLFALQVLLLGGAYGYGRWETSKKVDAANLETQHAAERAQKADARALDAQRAVWRLEARTTLERALAALEQRNFGTARTSLADAAARLTASAPEPGSRLADLQTRMATFELPVSEDIGSARLQVQAWIAELDKNTPQSPAPGAAKAAN